MSGPASKDLDTVVAVEKDTDAAVAKETLRQCTLGEFFTYASGADKALIALAIVCALLQGTAFPVFSVVLGDSVNTMGSALAGDETLVDMMAGARQGILALMIGCQVLGTAHNYLLGRCAERQACRLRKAYLSALLSRDQRWFDLEQAAGLPARLQKEVAKVSDGLGPKFGLCFVPLGQLLSGVLIGFWYYPGLALIICATLPMLAPSAFGLGRNMAAEAEMGWYAQAGAKAQEVLSAIRTVCAFGGEERETRGYATYLDAAAWGGVKAGLWFAAAFAWLFAIFGLSYPVAFWYASVELMEPEDGGEPIKGGDVMLVFFAVLIGTSGLTDAAVPVSTVQNGRVAMASILSVLRAKSEIEAPARGQPSDKPLEQLESIEFAEVKFTYPSRPDVQVLKGVSLTILRGQKVGFVGESGSGKSTVVQLLERFYDPESGQVKVNGKELAGVNLFQWRQSIGYVGQEPVLFALSVLENLRVACPGATADQCREACRRAEALDFLEALPLGLDTFVGSGGGQLSGGQKQRVAIARALVKNPQLLLLDEATSALDNESEKLVQATLNKLAADAGLTTLAIAHRLSTIKHSDQIFFLREGRIEERGTHDVLMAAQGGYFKLVEQQAAAQQQEEAPDAASSALVLGGVVDTFDGKPAPVLGSDPESPKKASKEEAALAKKEERLRELRAKPRAELNDAELEELRLEELKDFVEPGLGRVFREFADAKVKVALPLGLLGSLLAATMPLQGWVLVEVMFNFYLPYACPVEHGLDPADLAALFAGNATADPETFTLLSHIATCEDPKYAGVDSPLQHEVNKKTVYFLLLAGSQFVGMMLKLGCFRYCEERMGQNMREALLSKLLRQEVGFFDDPKNNAAGLLTSLQKSTLTVAKVCGLALGQQLESFCAILLGLILAFVASWQISLALLAMIPVLIASMGLLMTVMYSDEGMGDGGAFGRSAAVATEALLNIRTVRALRAETDIQQRFDVQVDATTVDQLGKKWQEATAYGFGMAMQFLLYIVAFWVCPYAVDEGWCTSAPWADDFGGDVACANPTTAEASFKAMFCVMFGAMGAGMGAIFFVSAGKAKIATADLFLVLDRQSSIDPVVSTGLRELPATQGPFIEFEKVSFFYPHRPEVQVLKGLSFGVARGESVALVGPSGSGKSSCISLLLRYYDVASGALKVCGTELTSLDVKWWRQQLGLVSQEPLLFDASVEDNIRYGKPDATREEVEAAGKLANLDFVFSGRVQWTQGVGAGGGQLSGGQKQRVAIARALVRGPAVLLLDEATSALDSASEQVVQQALDAARSGRTTFMIAHRLTTIQDADLILVICDGVVTERGTHESLLKQEGVYANLCRKAAQ